MARRGAQKEVLLDEAVEAGTITGDEYEAVYDLDLFVAGREGQGADARDALLAVEISNGSTCTRSIAASNVPRY